MFHPHRLDAASKRLLVAGVVLIWAVGLASGAVVAHEQATLDIDIGVLDTGGDERVVTTIELLVVNREPEPIPITVSRWTRTRKTQHPWRIVQGPSVLNATDAAVLTVTAGSRIHGIPRGEPAQITLTTPDGRRRAAITVTIPEEDRT